MFGLRNKLKTGNENNPFSIKQQALSMVLTFCCPFDLTRQYSLLIGNPFTNLEHELKGLKVL